MKSIVTGSVLLLCGAALALASGDTEGAAGAGAADAGMAVGGEPYVDHIFADPAAYEAATGNRIEGFGEAPVLAALVAEGALPPVEERLPVDVQVVRPRDEIGSYGGIMRGAGSSEEPGSAIESSNQSMGSYPPDTQAIYPNLIKAWEAADDFTSLSITLRAGMKWSDGSPVTVDDFRFWYEDVLLNPEITPRVNSRWRPGGEVMAMTVVDDATIRYSFAAPFYSVFESWAFQRPVLPAEYLKQWHAAHNPQADAKAREEGFDSWWKAFQDHEGGAVGKRSDPDRPSLHPWNVTEIGPASRLYERNPYYFKVDVAGNQLPYLDAVQITQFSQPNQTIPLRAMSGEIDLQTDHLAMADFPVYKENEATGDYQVYLFPFLSKGFAAGVALNYTHKDPVLREIFNDIRFRQALSLAIDRGDITNTFFFGRTVPHVAPVPPTWTGFEDWMRTYYAEFDPERANALLDEMGLQWDGNGQWRLRPDGEIVEFEGMWVAEWFSYFEGLVQMLSKQWEAVGVKMNPKFVVEEAAANIAIDNDQDALIGGNATSTEFRARGAEPVTLRPAWHWYSCCALAAAPWRLWHDTDGAEGIEPPQEIKDLFTISEEWRNTPRGTDRYAELSHQMIRMNVENLYFFGTVSIPPKVVLVSDRLGNMQREGGFVQTLPNFGPHMLDTLFIRR